MNHSLTSTDLTYVTLVSKDTYYHDDPDDSDDQDDIDHPDDPDDIDDPDVPED